ncbi:14 kDa phosphohistidine phosphatase-like protein [Aphelenchoides bicaudatus]|nr:14 kDa phosphohistidine phosphatase-like protein [Aphelenchoides bicaudatus]
MLQLVRLVKFPHFKLSVSRFSSAMGLHEIPDVDIDASGKFKYILIKAKDSKDSKFIVRGYARCGYHADIFDVVQGKAPKDVDLDCVGGGRILHDPAEKKLKVYGYSQGYGQADHSKSVEVLKKKYTDYDISFSNEGY